jgi:beta-xylosidase
LIIKLALLEPQLLSVRTKSLPRESILSYLTDKFVQNTGHADFVQDPHRNWWSFFLAVRLPANGCGPLGRKTFFTSVEWNEDGWPIFNGGKPIGLEVVMLEGLVHI